MVGFFLKKSENKFAFFLKIIRIHPFCKKKCGKREIKRKKPNKEHF